MFILVDLVQPFVFNKFAIIIICVRLIFFVKLYITVIMDVYDHMYIFQNLLSCIFNKYNIEINISQEFLSYLILNIIYKVVQIQSMRVNLTFSSLKMTVAHTTPVHIQCMYSIRIANILNKTFSSVREFLFDYIYG